MADETRDQYQPPDPPTTYPAPVSFVLRKLCEERNRTDQKLNSVTTVYTCDQLPTDLSSYKVGDIFILSDQDAMFYVKVVDGVKQLVQTGGASGEPLAGQTVSIDNDNQLYAAMEKVLVALGATVT